MIECRVENRGMTLEILERLGSDVRVVSSKAESVPPAGKKTLATLSQRPIARQSRTVMLVEPGENRAGPARPLAQLGKVVLFLDLKWTTGAGGDSMP